jgi:hypothetical protein
MQNSYKKAREITMHAQEKKQVRRIVSLRTYSAAPPQVIFSPL